MKESVAKLIAAPCTANSQVDVRLILRRMVIVPILCLRYAALVDVTDVVPHRLGGAMPSSITADVDSLFVAVVALLV